MDKNILGAIVKQRRDTLRISQEELSRLSGVGIKTIYALEQGKGNPSLSVLSKVLDVLGMEIKAMVKENN